MIQDRFEELKLSGSLPSPSGVGLSILRLAQREDASMEELLWCLQADPALTGRILKMANATRGVNEPACASVLQASLRLGMRAVRNASLGFTLVTGNRSGVCAPFGYDRYWSSSLACAVAAQVLARELKNVEPIEAFTLGLLSRIGMLALASVHPEIYARVLTDSEGGSQAQLSEAERRAFGLDQFEVTAAMLADWGLPEAFSQAVLVRAQGGPGETDGDVQVETLASLLESASRLALLLATDRVTQPLVFEQHWTALVNSGRKQALDEARLQEIAAASARAWKEWGEFLRIPTSELHGFVSAAAGDHGFGVLPILPEEPTAERAPAVTSRVERAPVRVLVVDDDVKLARLVGLHLSRAGYQVEIASDGTRALNIVLSEGPQIVITDWMMPGITGLELCQSLRKTEAGRKTYVLILTAKEEEDRIVDAFNAGADDYVAKPFNPRILLARVQAAQRLVELQAQVDDDRRIREQQVAEMGLLTRKLRAAALTDVLTDLPNRRFALSRLEQEWETALRLERPLSLVMIDIDEFKRINDQHGHAVGDFVLRATAGVLRTLARRGDIVCRLGGEEFLVINVNCDAQAALTCAERLRAGVEANFIEYQSFRGRVTVSLGVAERGLTIRDPDALLKAADEAVYAAKAGGRNTVRVADGLDGLARSA